MIQGINLDLIKMVNKPNDNTISKGAKEDKSFKSVLDNEKNTIPIPFIRSDGTVRAETRRTAVVA